MCYLRGLWMSTASLLIGFPPPLGGNSLCGAGVRSKYCWSPRHCAWCQHCYAGVQPHFYFLRGVAVVSVRNVYDKRETWNTIIIHTLFNRRWCGQPGSDFVSCVRAPAASGKVGSRPQIPFAPFPFSLFVKAKWIRRDIQVSELEAKSK